MYLYYKFPNEFFFEVNKRADLDIVEECRKNYISKQKEIEIEIDQEYVNSMAG